MTPPGNRFTAPLHGILPNTSLAMDNCMATYTVPRGIMIAMNRKSPNATSRSHPFPRLIRRIYPRHRHRQFCTIQRFRIDSTQSFWQDSTQDFPYLILLKVFDGIWLRFSWLDPTQCFLLDPTHFFRLNSTHIFWRDLNQVFPNSIQLAFNAIIFN